MALFSADVIDSHSVWRSPDGQREIFEVNLTVNGKQTTAKTYSNDIAQAGWSGDVESYEKPGKNGPQVFVRQAPKEGGFQPRQQGSHQSSTGASGSKPAFDNYTMYLSYVKDLAVALVNSGKFTPEALDELAGSVATTGRTFYEMSQEASKPVEVKKPDVIAPVQEDDPWNGLVGV